ncbi:MAG: tRNA (adenosine(37)-N6)-dimethylallyltransferase MiaA [Bacteroidales bacterium]|nr:tRNA (adenosine(37)-N6)-dimethylallyltransferase MiaA [Bacteroidales bacterium]
MTNRTIDPQQLAKAYADGRIDLICVLGPTASGKTRYAVQLASQLAALPESGTTTEDTIADEKSVKYPYAAEIISADSRQVYRGMTIGTGKDLDEYGAVPYHLIDIVPPGTKYNIYQYQRDFEAAYTDIRRRGAIPILCGGSGLYIEAATRGYSLPDVPANPGLRAELEKYDTETLIARLASLKTLHNTTDFDTRQRLVRALEIAIYAEEHPVNLSDSLPKNTYYIGISVTREERNRRIDARLDARLQEGMVDEVRSLMEGGLAPEDLIYYGLEYKYVTLYLTGRLDFEAMRKKLAVEIHRFAKRQMTWFRGMERKGIEIHWIDFEK